MKFGKFEPQNLRAANDNESDEELMEQEEKEYREQFDTKLAELMGYFEELNLDANILSQKIQKETLEDLRRSTDKDLMDLVVNSNRSLLQSHPAFFSAVIIEIANRTEQSA